MKKSIITYFFLLAFLPLLFISCEDNSLGKMRERELDWLDKYVKNNNIKEKPTSSGLYYIELEKGTGDSIKVNDVVQVLYKTWRISADTLILMDYNIDDAGHYYNPLKFQVTPPGNSSVVEGLNEGVKFMKLDGKAKMIVPSEIGYGQSTSSGVPAFSTLVFEIHVIKVQKPGTY